MKLEVRAQVEFDDLGTDVTHFSTSSFLYNRGNGTDKSVKEHIIVLTDGFFDN